MTLGIHHITAISSNSQDTIDFYTEILGLKLVKKSVNQDDPKTYHFFFGDKVGSPGMDLTFFPFFPAKQGTKGPGMVTRIYMAVKKGAINFWLERLRSFHLEVNSIKINDLGDEVIEFSDWDGQSLAIVATSRINNEAVTSGHPDIDPEFAIYNFYAAEISVFNSGQTLEVLKILGFELIKDEENYKILENTQSGYANLIFLQSKFNDYGYNSAGTVHHIAFRAKTSEVELDIRKNLMDFGLMPTEVIDRYYFKSVYFREPEGTLFEIATDEPGFDVDEDVEDLGKSLALPPFLESQRTLIESQLVEIKKPFKTKFKSELKSLFKFTELYHEAKKTIVLLHGTGGDENDLLGLIDEAEWNNYNILGLRGNIVEDGLNRFFKRFDTGKYDEESIRDEASKLRNFINKYLEYREIKIKDLIFVGFSNGANMILALSLLYPELITKMALLHPAKVLEPDSKIDLSKVKAFVSYGQFDHMIPMKESKEVLSILESLGANVEEFDNDSDHSITEIEVLKLREFLKRN